MRNKIMKRKRQLGMTLIEIMITVAIISILAAVALPSYERYLQRSKRVDATTALMKIATEQEKYYFKKNTYGTAAQIATQINGTTTLATQSGYYTLAVSSATATDDFSVTATHTGSQLKDTDCKVLTINQDGNRTAKNTANADTSTICWK